MQRVHGHNAPVIELKGHFADREQTLRLLVGKRLKEHRVDKREDGGVCADADGEGKDSNSGETGIPADAAKGVTEILGGGIENRQPALLSIAFLG